MAKEYISLTGVQREAMMCTLLQEILTTLKAINTSLGGLETEPQTTEETPPP